MARREVMAKRAVLVLLLLLFSLFFFLGTAVRIRAQEKWEDTEPGAAERLSRAVAKAKICGKYKVVKTRVENGVEKTATLGEEDGKAMEKLSLPLLFKPGRFALSCGNDQVLSGRVVSVVNFEPQPQNLALQAVGDEDRHYNRAMNHLQGSVFIDTETGSIVRIEARLLEAVPYIWAGIEMFKLKSLDFEFDQRLKGERWIPSHLQLNVKYWRLVGWPRNGDERTSIPFTCS